MLVDQFFNIFVAKSEDFLNTSGLAQVDGQIQQNGCTDS
jgi:hypothetical protein